MKIESGIRENFSTTTIEPITDAEEVIKAICEWNGITIDEFRQVVGSYKMLGTDYDNKYIYVLGDTIINPIGVYLMNVYDGKDVVFEKGNDKFFGILRVRAEDTKYMLGEKVIDIPFRIRAVNEDTQESIIIFPKASDIVQKWMRGLYVVSPGWAERQRIEKEIVAKMIELAMVKGGNEIISTQSIIEDLKANLKKSGIELSLGNELISLDIPRRELRDTAGADSSEYIAPPIQIEIDFMNRNVKCKGYSPHGFGTPNSWGNPCWGNYDNEVYNCLQNCSIKELINLIISWAYGYNSADTGQSHDGRHPVAKLRDYVWYLNDNKDKTEVKTEIEKMKGHLEQVKRDLNLDDWLEGCNTIKNFISSLEGTYETAE